MSSHTTRRTGSWVHFMLVFEMRQQFHRWVEICHDSSDVLPIPQPISKTAYFRNSIMFSLNMILSSRRKNVSSTLSRFSDWSLWIKLTNLCSFVDKRLTCMHTKAHGRTSWLVIHVIINECQSFEGWTLFMIQVIY